MGSIERCNPIISSTKNRTEEPQTKLSHSETYLRGGPCQRQRGQLSGRSAFFLLSYNVGHILRISRGRRLKRREGKVSPFKPILHGPMWIEGPVVAEPPPVLSLFPLGLPAKDDHDHDATQRSLAMPPNGPLARACIERARKGLQVAWLFKFMRFSAHCIDRAALDYCQHHDSCA